MSDASIFQTRRTRKRVERMRATTKMLADNAKRQQAFEAMENASPPTLGQLARDHGLSYPAIWQRFRRGLRGEALVKPTSQQSHRMPKPELYKSIGHPVGGIELTEKQISIIKRIRATRLMADTQIAVRLNIPLAYILAINRPRGKAGALTRYEIGLESLTVPEIAKRADVTRATIYNRIDVGVRGADLLAPRHQGPRRARRGLPGGRVRRQAAIWDVVDGVRIPRDPSGGVG